MMRELGIRLVLWFFLLVHNVPFSFQRPLFVFLYTGGGNICENLFWGRITGENAAKESSWD